MIFFTETTMEVIILQSEAFVLMGIYKVSGDQLLSKGFDPSKSTGRALDSKGEYSIPIYYIFQLINLGNDNYLIKKI